ILDGMPIKSIDEIQPNEIESINYLKDPSSKSLYGEAAKNGVILITSKRGHVENLQNKMEDVTVIGYGKANVKKEISIFNAPKIQKDVDF
ncbi:MAG: hypothetical protein ACR2IM_03575, partial [Sediminibacterium sp.]